MFSKITLCGLSREDLLASTPILSIGCRKTLHNRVYKYLYSCEQKLNAFYSKLSKIKTARVFTYC